MDGLIVYHKKYPFFDKINYIEDNSHTLIIGGTGLGKTRRFIYQLVGILGLAKKQSKESSFYQFNGETIIILDPKRELYLSTYLFLLENGYDVKIMDYRNPNQSSCYNYLQCIIDSVNNGDMQRAEELTLNIANSLIEDNSNHGERIWKDGAISVLATAILATVIDNKENYSCQNLTNVLYFITEMCKCDSFGNEPIAKYLSALPDDSPVKKLSGIFTIAPQKTRSSFYTMAITSLRLFASTSIRNITCKSDFKLKDIGEKKTALFISLPDEKIEYYSLASLLISQIYIELINVANKNGGELDTRVNFILEEFFSYPPIPNFATMLTVARSRNIRFFIVIQSFVQLTIKYSKDLASNILDNCKYWAFLGSESVETKEMIEKKLGTYTTLSSSNSKTTNNNLTLSTNLISRSLLKVEEISKIRNPYVLILGSTYPLITKISDISKWNFNHMFGLKDKKYNKQLMLKRDKKILSPIKNDNFSYSTAWDSFLKGGKL